MRLGQLARKLSLRPSQLVDFLSEQDIETPEGSNARLDDAHVKMLIEHFAPESMDEILKPAPVVEEIVQPEPVIEEPVLVESEVKSEPVLVEETLEVEAKEQPVEHEVIRVQKIELSGLKVLGKIDLPEPKKKEIKTEENSETTEAGDQRRTRGSVKQKNQKREREQRPWRNPMEAQRLREARELEEKQKADLEREKEKRKHHYQNKVKQVQQPKRTKPVKATAVVKKPTDKRPVPKTWLGKFFRWWTT